MDILAEIRQKLLNGKQPAELVKEGFAKSSVYSVAKKIKNLHPDITSAPVPDEIQELRHQKEIMKLKREIAELEDSKEKIPGRLEKLEAEVLRLNKAIPNLVWDCYASLYAVILLNKGWNKDAARQEAIRITNDFLKHFGY
ncbi:hypothetical protein ACFLV6_00040 [Chloroflexota bacterium]